MFSCSFEKRFVNQIETQIHCYYWPRECSVSCIIHRFAYYIRTADCLTVDREHTILQSIVSFTSKRKTMFGSLKHCIRALNKLNKTSVSIEIRSLSQYSEQTQSNFGKDGHYDIIIVGGGATGISLAGAIGI